MSKLDNYVNFNKYVENIISNNKLSHAYIIEINDYEKDFVNILSFVKRILCKNNININNINKCNKCNICSLINNNNYPDLYIIEPDGKFIKKEQLINLKKDFQNKSLFNNKKIYIIKEADKLNDSSANTILKFLEEPEEDIVAILLTNNRYKIIDTILSRCQILKINNKKEYDGDDSLLDLLHYLLDGYSLFINYNDILNNILIDKDTCICKLKNIQEIFIDYLYNKEDNIYKELLNDVSYNYIVNLSLIIDEYLKKLDFNVNYKLWLDSFFSSVIGCEKNV